MSVDSLGFFLIGDVDNKMGARLLLGEEPYESLGFASIKYSPRHPYIPSMSGPDCRARIEGSSLRVRFVLFDWRGKDGNSRLHIRFVFFNPESAVN